ncbi:MAG TPA: hypothetical protein VI172_09450 [Candidatus Dormibacteraeota bacterium]|jgi:hypothetical protein
MPNGTVVYGEDEIKDRHISTTAQISTSKMAQRVLAVTGVPLTQLRIWDGIAVNLTATPNTDDLGITTGTYGTNHPYVSAGDLKAAGATTRRARFLVPLPNDYEAAQTVQINLIASMTTTVADTSCTIDVEAWRLDEDGTLGAADLCATSAQSMNSLTPADKTFNITAATLEPGDFLDVRISIACTDAATVTAVIPSLWKVELWADLR